ncbi:MAG: FAD-dependent oxidoreductase, partial [Rhodanobacter sp.]
MNTLPERRRAPALDIAVVGGGMVGAAAALALAKAGFSTALLEAREPTPWRAGDEVDLRVVGLAPSSIELLDGLGVWTSIRDARSSPYAHMHVWDSESGAAIDFSAADDGRDLLGHIVENNLVQWTLWQALEAGGGSSGTSMGGVRRLCPADVRGFEAREDRVVLELVDGESLSARLLVAADGAASPLRDMAGIATRGRDYA